MLKIKIHKDTRVSYYAYNGNAGADLYAIKDYILKIKHRILISTEIRMEIPEGFDGQIRPKLGVTIGFGSTEIKG